MSRCAPGTEGEACEAQSLPLDEELREEAHQQADLLLRAPPVLGRERVEGQLLDPQPRALAGHGAHRLGADLVSVEARLAALLGPAAVAVHDDRHGLGQRGERRVAQSTPSSMCTSALRWGPVET